MNPAPNSTPESHSLLKRALVYVQQDAQMMADITRFAPLPASAQAEHDNTETDSERLCREIPEFLAKASTPPDPAIAAAREIHQPNQTSLFYDDMVITSAAIISKHFAPLRAELATMREDCAEAIRQLRELDAELQTARETIRLQQREVNEKRATNAALLAHRDKNFWIWQGDVTDQLESLGCYVLIHANQLRAALAARTPSTGQLATAQKQIAEFEKLFGLDTPWTAVSLYKALVIAESKFREDGRDFDGWESIQSAAAVAQQRVSDFLKDYPDA